MTEDNNLEFNVNVSEAAEYTDDSIRHLSDVEHLRLRPGMYIGKLGDGSQSDDGIYVLLKEVIDNCIDEFKMGFGKRLEIDIVDNHAVTVRDYGRGIPQGMMIEAVSKLNTGAKYDDKVFKKSVGLNGVGLKAVNALSANFEVRSYRDGVVRTATFEKGELTSDTTGKTADENGTFISFTPDNTIFRHYEFRAAYIETLLRNYTYLNTGLAIMFNGKRILSRNGLTDLLTDRMTADPRVINNAYTIGHLSYVEATELCNCGAKVVYPPTIYPVFKANIPIKIKNTFNPSGEGTIIDAHSENEGRLIKGISSINDTDLLTVQGLGMVGVVGVNHRIFRALGNAGISVFLVAQASSENSTSIGLRHVDADKACEVLNKEFEREISMGLMESVRATSELSTVAIVGENMRQNAGIIGKLFQTLGRNGINVVACAQGGQETNISFVIKADLLRKTLNVIHDSFFLSEYKVLNLFICGVGTVGGSLIEQIVSQQEKLKKEHSLKLNIVGIANSRNAIFDREGLDTTNYKTALKESAPSSIEKLRNDIIEMNIFNSVFVDCTASSEVATIYADLLSHNISVVAANKIAASADYATYNNLKQIARQRNIKYLFETNVGAGLPIINTINDLINSGDKILKIEAVLSGTLNFIFNILSNDIQLSEAVRLAQEKGYSEPDPRIDLCGKDVIRKLVILAREAGYSIEQSDVEANLFIPQELFDGTLENFWAKLPQLDAQFEEERKKLVAEKMHWRFIAKYENGKGSVSLCKVNERHPFYHLEGSNNIILLTTERYKEYPMLIQGYGAGASVTAAGVFADIMRIANI